jgi:MFS family permease
MQYLRFVKSNLRFLGFGYLIAFISTFGQTFYIAMYSGELRAAFDLSHGDFGNIYAIGTLSSGMLLIWVGKLIDRIDLRIYSLLLCAGMALACAVMSFAQGVVMLTIAIFLLRITGQGLLSQAATVTMARYFDDFSRGRAVSLAALGFPTGQALFPAISVVVLVWLPWRDAWLASAVALITVIPPLLLCLLKGHGARHVAFLERAGGLKDRAATAARRQWTRTQVLRDARFFLAMIAMMSTAFIITGLNLHQVHLVESKGWELSIYASSFAIYAVCQVGISVVTGMLVDRYGAIWITPFYMLPLVGATFVIAGFDSPLAIFAFMALAGTTGGAGATIVSTIWVELYGALHLGSIKAMVAGIQVISSALGPAVFGWLIDGGVSIEAISVVCGVYAFGGCVLLAALFRPRLLTFWRA